MFKKIRFWYWTVSAFVKKYVVGLTIGGIIGIALAIYGDQLIKVLPAYQTIHIARIGSPTVSQIPLDIEQYISRGLTKITPTGDWEPDVAQSITVSDDGTVYTAKLKPTVNWSDHMPFTSADFDMSIKDVAIERPDSQTILFKLKDPYAPFPTILSQPLLKKTKIGLIRKRTQIIGLNPFVLQTVQTVNQRIKSLTLKSGNTTLVYHFYPTEEEALTAYKLGHVDVINGINAPYLEDWPRVQVTKESTSNRYLTLFFNTANPTLQDKSIRQMLAYATPKKADDSRVISPINKRSWVYNPQVKPYTQNIDTAKSMLDRLKKANPQLSLEFVLTTTPAYVDMAQRIIDAWQPLGIQATLKIVPVPDVNDYEILLIGQQVPDDPDQYSLWHSTQPITNIAHYQSPKIDKLLEDGRKELGKEPRKEIYQDFQRFLVEDCPAVFLNELPLYTISRAGILLPE